MGPLAGIRTIEFAGLGAAPFCAMMLADMGAEVIRIDRPDVRGRGSRHDLLNRGRRSVTLDLKNPAALSAAMRLVSAADILVEGFRPGVLERLGLGPEPCAQRNPRLVYGRMTGWGQSGPLSMAAGHDINYISLAGVLHAIGPGGSKPVPPLNLVGDYGGGMMMAFGLACGVLEARTSGKGQVVDGAMLDAAALTMNRFLGLWSEGLWTLERGSNYLDGGAPFYDTYVCADGKYISIGPIEPQFYQLLLEKLDVRIDPSLQMQESSWEAQKAALAAVFTKHPQHTWCQLLEGTDVCFAPILALNEAPSHPHNKSRNTFIEVDGVVQAAPAPRFSRTPAEIGLPPPVAGEHNTEALERWGFSADEVADLRNAGAFGQLAVSN